MKVSKSPIDGLIIIEPKVFRDSRGLFYEVYSESRYKEHGVSARFVQDNHSSPGECLIKLWILLTYNSFYGSFMGLETR